MSSDLAIDIQGLNKVFAIFDKPNDRLKQMIWRSRKKFYREFWALKDINLELKKGETLGVIGRNGSGKSTLLQIICGTLEPTSGNVSVQGRIAGLLELGAGFNPEFTGRENVFLAASILGLNEEQIKQKFSSILDFAGIGEFIDQPVKLYSSGMYARLAFAVAAHVDAEILIIDEILAVGDASFTQKCMRFIHNYRKSGTLLFVSHDTAAVVNLCDKALWLDGGTVREFGPSKDVCHNYLSALNSELDQSAAFKIGGSRKSIPVSAAPKKIEDPRDQIFKEVSGNQAIEMFSFDPDSPWFGERGASIESLSIRSLKEPDRVNIEGGEEVVLEVICEAHRDIESPIIGFFIKDRLGQHLFGDNTFLTYADVPLSVSAGAKFSAKFHFQLPYLPSGDYSVMTSVAEGTQSNHKQHHWLDDALFFKVHASHVCRGLIGIPMIDIKLDVNLSES